MASLLTFWVSPNLSVNSEFRARYRGRTVCSSGGDPVLVSSDEVYVNGAPVVKEKEKIGSSIHERKGGLGFIDTERMKGKEEEFEQLKPMWDDGFGTSSMKDYLDAAKEMIKPDGGPPRWFCPVECGRPLKNSPLLLFLPGMDGVGLGLIMHHKALGKVFEVRCLHIPVQDRTSFEGLVKFVEETVRQEHTSSPNKPIYLVGDSFGGCLALAVASRNPSIDLVLILANPATSLERSQLQPLFPLLETLPDELHSSVPYLLSFVMGEPVKMAMADIDTSNPPMPLLRQLSQKLTALLPRLSVVADIIPKETLLWKLKLLKSAAAYTNSRLHAVSAEVLLLASGKDNMLPSGDEAKRLMNTLKNCKVRYFKDNGHTLLLEDSIGLLTIIKATNKYRRSRRMDHVLDFLPPSISEFKETFNQYTRAFRTWVSPVMFSTLEDGRIVRGLHGVPSEGPVLLVGYHMLVGLELSGLVEGFLKEKNVMLRGLAHPELFSQSQESAESEFSYFDRTRIFGGVPVTAINFFKLLQTKSHVLLYPGGAREALHRKGEGYQLLWPDRAEFVRMAARFGATIVPFGVVGQDDILELVLDYNDLMRIPMVNEQLKQKSREMIRVRADVPGEVANEDLYIPGVAPKIPGRFYYLFAKPIETRGKEKVLKDKQNANELYLQIKSEVSSSIEYLLRKREEDPFRNIIDRTIYRVLYADISDIPTFSP